MRSFVYIAVFWGTMGFLALLLGAPEVHAAPGDAHPDGWGTVHGKFYEQSHAACEFCHGKDLFGGTAKISCNLCHLSPKHPVNWKETHGVEFLAKHTQCTICHSKRPFSGLKKPETMNCTRCHSVNSDISRWQPESQTSQAYINFSNSLQTLENRFGNRELTTDTYGGFHLSERSEQMAVSSQFRLSREWEGETMNGDLYEAQFQMDNLLDNRLDITLGRQAFISNVDFFLADGATFITKPSKWFDLSTFVGIPRYIERNDLDGEVGIVAGQSVILKEIDYTNARLDFTYQKDDFSTADTPSHDPDEMTVSLSASKGISVFKLYGLGEYYLTDPTLQTATIGAEIYPFPRRVGFLLEGSRFNESRERDFDTVYKMFAVDEMWQLRSGVFFSPMKNLRFEQDLSYQSYHVLDDYRKYGINAKTAVSYRFDPIKLDMDAAYSFVTSYGGTANGARVMFYEEWTDAFFSSLFADYVRYSKITGDNNDGFDVGFTSGMKFAPAFTASGTLEYLKNDVFDDELRGLFKLDYLFDMKFLEFDKRKAEREKAREKAKEKT